MSVWLHINHRLMLIPNFCIDYLVGANKSWGILVKLSSLRKNVNPREIGNFTFASILLVVVVYKFQTRYSPTLTCTTQLLSIGSTMDESSLGRNSLVENFKRKLEFSFHFACAAIAPSRKWDVCTCPVDICLSSWNQLRVALTEYHTQSMFWYFENLGIKIRNFPQ